MGDVVSLVERHKNNLMKKARKIQRKLLKWIWLWWFLKFNK
jgi:hypothetical protein